MPARSTTDSTSNHRHCASGWRRWSAKPALYHRPNGSLVGPELLAEIEYRAKSADGRHFFLQGPAGAPMSGTVRGTTIAQWSMTGISESSLKQGAAGMVHFEPGGVSFCDNAAAAGTVSAANVARARPQKSSRARAREDSCSITAVFVSRWSWWPARARLYDHGPQRTRAPRQSQGHRCAPST